MTKIDVFNHIVTPRYREARLTIAPPQMRLQDQERAMPALFDLDARFRAMDTAGDGYVQIINTANPPVEHIAGPVDALELSRIANDEMAELVSRFPERFAGAAACIPMNDVDAAIAELNRAIRQLGFRGVQIYTDVQGRPLDDPRSLSSSTAWRRSIFRCSSIPCAAPIVPTTPLRIRAASIRGASSAGCTTPWRR